MMSQDLIFTVEFQVKPEAREAFLAGLHEVVDKMAQEETFVSSYLQRDANDPNRFMIYERWSEPSFEAFVDNQLKGKRYRDDYESKIADWLVEDRAIKVFEPMGVWEKGVWEKGQ